MPGHGLGDAQFPPAWELQLNDLRQTETFLQMGSEQDHTPVDSGELAKAL